MKMLVNEGDFTILMGAKEIANQLLNIERAGRTCYKSDNKEITAETAMEFVRMIMRRGHESVIEHSHLPVRFYDISRGFTHEMVRHRLCAFSQESTRYVDYAKEGELDLDRFSVHCIAPSHRDLGQEHQVSLPNIRMPFPMSIADMFCTIENMYRALRKAGWATQDARQVLPIGLRSEIVVSCNFREWRHIFSMRTALAAHWEIRRVMCNLLSELKRIIPIIFCDFVYGGEDKDGYPYFIRNPAFE